MFTDHMFFSGATEMFEALVMLTSVGWSYRVQCFNRHPKVVPLHPAPGSSAHTNPIDLSTLRKSCACYSNSFRSGGRVARNIGDLFPSGCRAPANGKEETSC
jgi:hypothetical protein